MTPDDPGMDLRFRKSERLTRRPQFLEARRQGRRAEGRWVILYLAENQLDHPRLGVTVSKRVGNAVVRNRWKRRLREIFRHQKREFGAHDVVIIVKRGAETPTFEELQADVLKALKRGLRHRTRTRR